MTVRLYFKNWTNGSRGLPAKAPCIRHRFFPLTRGAGHGVPLRVLARHLGALLGSPLGLPFFKVFLSDCMALHVNLYDFDIVGKSSSPLGLIRTSTPYSYEIIIPLEVLFSILMISLDFLILKKILRYYMKIIQDFLNDEQKQFQTSNLSSSKTGKCF